MMGSGAGGGSPLGNRTMVGIRGLTTITPTTTEKTDKKKKTGLDKKVDSVEREDERKNLFQYVDAEPEEEEEKVAQPAGHAQGMRVFEDEAFRTAEKIAPTYSDVDQGNLADAWLLASAAAVAHAQPALLLKRITRHDNKSWMIRIGDDTMVVSPEFMNEGYADPTPNGQRNTLWVALLEKAFALHEGGSYANLETGNPARALEALTGKKAKRVSLTERTGLDGLFTTLREGKRANAAMVFHTREVGVAQPLHVEHCYAVIDVYERDGVKLVKLYNPWGTNGGQKKLESLIHEVKIEALRADCDALFVSGV
jgi:hypothetical protein